jgi:hypothetical protein
LAELQRIFRELPQKILFYGAQGSISEKGETRSFAKYILQHHIELLQALMLTVPVIADCPDRPTKLSLKRYVNERPLTVIALSKGDCRDCPTNLPFAWR